MTTVRLYFRNMMLFVHRDDGTDVWFMASHAAHVLTRDRVVPLQRSVIRISSNGKTLPGRGRLSIDLPRVISFNTLAPQGVVSETIKKRQFSDDLIARLELPLAGSLRDLPSVHSYGVLLDWRTPVVGAAEAHLQRLTEVAVFEVHDVPEPAALVVEHPEGPPLRLELEPSPGEPGVAEAFFLAGELPDNGPGPELKRERERDLLRIDEFSAFHECFENATKSGLKASDVIPTAERPAGDVFFRTARPFCPSAQFGLQGNRRP